MAGSRTPQVVSGRRTPVDRLGTDPESAVKDIAAARAAVNVPKAEGEVVYQAIAARHRIQITSPRVIVDPYSGEREYRRGKAAQFEEFEFRTKDPEIIARLDSHRHYGLGKHFWRAEEGRKQALEAAVESLTNTVKAGADPETARRLIAELTPIAGQDFKLPAPPTANPSKEPAPVEP